MYQTLNQEGFIPRTILLKGAPGSGKTWKAGQFPSPVIFNFDKNVAGLRKLGDRSKDIKIIDPTLKFDAAKKELVLNSEGKPIRLKGRNVWDNFIDMLGIVFEDPSVKTIIIDSITTLQEFLMDKILGGESPDKAMQIQNYGTLQRYWKLLGEELCLNDELGKHIIMIAHEQGREDSSTGSVVLKYVLNMVGSMKESFDLYFTDVWRTWVKTSIGKPAQFMVSVQPTTHFSAKTSLELPAQFEWDTEWPNIQKQL